MANKDDNWLTVGLIGGGIALLMAIFGLVGGNKKNDSSMSGGSSTGGSPSSSGCTPCQAKRGM